MLIGLSPTIDHHGALLRFDYYAIRAREHNYLLSFVENFTDQVYQNRDKTLISCVKLMPNFLMSSALACKEVCKAL